MNATIFYVSQTRVSNSSPLEGETADLSQAAEVMPFGLSAPQAVVVLLIGALLWIYLLRKRV